MSLNSKVYSGFVTFALAAFALWGFDVVRAQRAPAVPAASTATPTPTPKSDEEEIIRVDTEVVNVLFTAQDRNRRLLTDLKQSDVKILENGQSQEITAFSRQVDLPL